MRILFFGSPTFAVPSLRALHAAGHTVVAAVSQPDAPAGRGNKLQAPPVKEAALALGIPVLQPERIKPPKGDAFIAQVKELHADLGVVAAYGKILPQVLLDAPRAGCVNLHGSLLPRFRGASPVQHAILEGDAETGVCLMRMVLELDAGGVFATARTPITEEDTAESLMARLGELAADLCVRHVQGVLDGTLPEVPQAAAGLTYAPLLTKDMGRLRLDGDAAREARRVRAFTPWPGGFIARGNEPLKVHAARAVPGDGGAPGTILDVGAGHVDVACGSGVLRLLEVQPAGKKRMDAGAWARGARLARGQAIA